MLAADDEDLRQTPFVDGDIRPNHFACLRFDSGRIAKGCCRFVDSLLVIERELDMHKSFVGRLFIATATAIAAAPSAAFAETVSNEAASASANSSAIADTAAKPAAKAEKKICKWLPSSYSRLSDRVCLTQREWKQVEDQLD